VALVACHIAPEQCVFVTENTGVYGEKLYYFCHRHKLTISMEPAHYIRRAFRLKPKTDPVDSRMIAEYGFRYRDQLHIWKPPSPVVEQVRILLVNNHQLQKTATASKNIMKALSHKEHADYAHMHRETIEFLDTQRKIVKKAIKAELQKDSIISQHTTNLLTVPGIGVFFCANFLVVTEGYRSVDYRNLAGYLGMAPAPYQSGTSVYRPPKSDKKGPKRMRRQLYISVMSALKHHKPYQEYFARMTAKGKPGKVVMNNLENKLLRTACAIVLSNRPYDKNFRSVRTSRKNL